MRKILPNTLLLLSGLLLLGHALQVTDLQDGGQWPSDEAKFSSPIRPWSEEAEREMPEKKDVKEAIADIFQSAEEQYLGRIPLEERMADGFDHLNPTDTNFTSEKRSHGPDKAISDYMKMKRTKHGPMVREGEDDAESTLRDPDHLCTNETIEGDKCVVRNKWVLYTKNNIERHLELKTMEFHNVTMVCINDDNVTCILSFRLHAENSEIKFLNGSGIMAKGIYVESPNSKLTIDENSYFSASGASQNTKGTDLEGRQGASYVGQGGYCGTENVPNLVHGSFDMNPLENVFDLESNNLIGSMGDKDNVFTGGGGHIHINVYSLTIYSNYQGTMAQIQANGRPEWNNDTSAENMNGGSGGYIFIDTHEDGFTFVSYYARIEAKGGQGKGRGYGGAGGVIIIGENVYIARYKLFIDGGRGGSAYALSDDAGCQNGASGTAYFDYLDILYIDNEENDSTRYTYVSATEKMPDEYPGQMMVAKTLIAGANSGISIKNTALSHILFPSLLSDSNSTIRFDFDRTPRLSIQYVSTFILSDNSTLDSTKIVGQTTVDCLGESSFWWNHVQLGHVKFSNSFKIITGMLFIHNTIHDPSYPHVYKPDSKIELFANFIIMLPNVEIQAAKVMMFANESMYFLNETKIESTVPNSCYEHLDGNRNLYQCIDPEMQTKNLTYEGMLDYYNSQFGINNQASHPHFARHSWEMGWMIMSQWHVYIMSLHDIYVNGTNFIGPRVGLCSNDQIVLQNSLVETSKRGCLNDRGLGKGIRYNQCSGPGASHGGYGGFGGAIQNNQKDACESKYPKPYSFGVEARYEGSGGASGDAAKTTGGYGGGIAWLQSPYAITLDNSKVLASGGHGRVLDSHDVGAGGGSGGSIQVTTRALLGDGHLIARGGDGSQNEGGGGSGGRIVMNFIQSYLETSYPLISMYWTGDFDISGGRAGQKMNLIQDPGPGEDGTVMASKCLPGYHGPFCKACPIGTFKSEYGYTDCLPCMNKPENAIYIQEAEDSSLCSYECEDLETHERAKHNPDCLDPISLEYQRIGGAFPFFIVMLLFLWVSLIVFICLSYKTQSFKFIRKNSPHKLYTAWEEHDEKDRGKSNEQFFGIKDANVWGHTHRMYLVGDNSFNFPWKIPKDFPKDALPKHERETLLRFIDSHNPLLQWSTLERYLYYFISIFYLPAARHLHSFMRKEKAKALQIGLYRSFPPQFWGDKGDNKTIRFRVCQKDYMLAYIDFIDFEKTEETWDGIKLPQSFLLAGNGSFNHPYRFEYQEDPLAKSIALIKFDFMWDKLPVFFENFNSQLSKLSFFKLHAQVMSDLFKTVNWIEDANSSLFRHFKVKAVLYIIENQYKEVEIGRYQQRRRSFPLESIFFHGLPDMYSRLVSYIRQKITTHKSEFKLALVFKEYDKTKATATKLRLKTMKVENGLTPFRSAVYRQESVLFDDQDSTDVENQISYKNPNREKDHNSYLPNTSQATEKATPEAPIQGSDQRSNSVLAPKVVSKSISAFSVTMASTKAFEIAIRKPRKKWKHVFAQTWADIYGTFLLAFKYHGEPPDRKNYNMILMAYSMLLTLDVIMVINFFVEIVTVGDEEDSYDKWGWAFLFVYFGLPIAAPIIGFFGALWKDTAVIKEMSNLNSIMLTFNIPLSVLSSIFHGGDPVFVMMFAFFTILKMGISITSGQIRQIMANPRFASNRNKLSKILTKQTIRKYKRDQILGIKEKEPQVVQMENGRHAFVQEEDPLQKAGLDVEKLNAKLLDY